MPEAGTIAITGIGCRFPGGVRGPAAFWRLLVDGVDAVGEVPPDRWNIAAYYDPARGTPGKTDSRWGGFVDDIDKFDAGFFGISPREAAYMDPQQRLLMETAWDAAEDAGVVVGRPGGRAAGVFVGMSTFDYWKIQAGFADKSTIGPHSTTGTVLSIAANRISYALDLRGPSVVVDTACSSSMVAVHMACGSLLAGECGHAFAGGANAIIIPDTFVGFSAMSMLSPDGRCKAFDARANGFVRGEGAGFVVLRRLEDALADGDRIYCVVLATGVNQDGRTGSLTIPSRGAQEELLRQTCGRAGIDPAEIDFAEAHGTGTAVGDPNETGAIGAVAGGGKRRRPCRIGSVKTNIGHLEAASGIAGLIKAALALRAGKLPPSLHFVTPNPAIDFEGWNLRVPTEVEPLWRADAVAVVNSFGFGGTNAQALLRGWPGGRGSAEEPARPEVFVLSARDEAGLRALTGDFRDWLGVTREPLANVAATLANRRTHLPWRLAVAAADRDDAVEKLGAWLAGESRFGLSAGQAAEVGSPVFVFTGQGPQWYAMGRGMLETDPDFRARLDECGAFFKEWGGWSLVDELMRDKGDSRIDHPSFAQPAIFALQVALTDWWRARGVTPAAVIGHSVGEAAAAYFCGALDLASAARVIFERGRCMELVPPTGGMLAVGLSAEAVRPWIAGFRKRVEIGAVNAPESVVLSGEPGALDEIAERLGSVGVWQKRVRVRYAFHSRQMDPIRRELAGALKGIRAGKPVIPAASTVTGGLADAGCFGAGYWWGNVREPVRFSDGVRALIREGFTTFLEVGPHPALTASLKECLRVEKKEGLVVHSLRRGENDRTALLAGLGELHVAGVPVQFEAGGVADLPPRPFQRESYWHEAVESLVTRTGPAPHPLLGFSTGGSEPGWRSAFATGTQAWAGDHVVGGRVIFPAAAYLEMAVSAARQISGGLPVAVGGMEFERAMMVGDDPCLLEFRTEGRDFVISSKSGRAGWQRHCAGKFHQPGGGADHEPPDVVRGRCPEEISATELYDGLREGGLEFGPAFRRVRRVFRRDGEALAEIDGTPDAGGFLFHPAVLDACFHAVLSALPAGERGHFLPAGVGRFHVAAEASGDLWSHVARVRQGSAGECEADIRILAPDGGLVARIGGFRLKPFEVSRGPAGEARFYETRWQELALEAAERQPAKWSLVGGSDAERRSLAEALAAAGDEICETPSEGGGVVCFSQPGEDAPAAIRECGRLIGIVNSLPPGCGLVVVTRRGQPADTTAAVSPAQGALVGLTRVIANERVDLSCRCIDISTLESPEDFAALAAELRFGGEEEAALRGTARFVPRIAACEPGPRSLSGSDVPFRLDAKPGCGLDGARFGMLRRRAPGPGEVEIGIRAGGVNFRDVMKLLGIYPIEEPLDSLIGDECAGEVVALGEGVDDLAVGDFVAAICPGSFASHATVPRPLVFRLPSGWSPEEAATTPVAFLTAWYALAGLARVVGGERVLVHAGAGGVGMAAIQIAKLAGAEVIATAGNEEKRAVARELGAGLVLDSRTLEFADAIREATGGAGVDVALNSLSGEALTATLSVMAPFGRFLEIGKRDIYGDSRLGMKVFAKNLSFFAIDLGRLVSAKRDLAGRMLAELSAEFAAGRLRPLRVSARPLSRAEDAFREMAAGRHIGKLALVNDPESLRVDGDPAGSLELRADGFYLVTGGTRGFGYEIVRWMAARGARNFAITCATRASAAAARARLAELPSGCRVLVEAVDAGEYTGMTEFFARAEGELGPVRGVVHAAMKIDDALLADMTADRLEAAMGPKAFGAWILHSLTMNRPIDFFLMTSSIASFVGNPGQANYVAANAFLDALAHHRRALGLPAAAVHFGRIGGTGYVEDNAHVAASSTGTVSPPRVSKIPWPRSSVCFSPRWPKSRLCAWIGRRGPDATRASARVRGIPGSCPSMTRRLRPTLPARSAPLPRPRWCRCSRNA